MSRVRFLLGPAGLCAFSVFLTAIPLQGQGLPPYSAINPLAEMRSGLATHPRLDSDRFWSVHLTTEYGSLIEYAGGRPERLVLDSEISVTRLWVARSIGERAHVSAGISWNHATSGYMDGFFDAVHDVIGVTVAGRDRRPENSFAYRISLGDRAFEYTKGSGFLGDLRLGVGLRHRDAWQTAFSLTLPTGIAPRGFRKGVTSANLTTMVSRDFGRGARYGYEGTIGVGFTPRWGELREWQNTTFLLFAQGVRARVMGPVHGYLNVVVVSPYYHDTGIQELNLHEFSIDLGALVPVADGPTWFFGMTQDLLPNGPAVDVVFRAGAYW